MHRRGIQDDDSSNSDNSSVFSPVSSRQRSLHQSMTPERTGNSLPRLNDNSWIGARVSPIQNVDRHHESDNFLPELERGPLHESLEASFVYVPSERSSLLGKNGMNDPKSSLHPLWHDGNAESADRKTSHGPLCGTNILGSIVTGASGIILACIALHDSYLWYLRFRKGVTPQFSIAWTLPWLSPPDRTLVRFGSFYPSRVIARQQYWRFFTSMFVSTSFMEWFLIGVGWLAIRSNSRGQRRTSWASTLVSMLMYVLSCSTGQLWMMCFHPSGIAGCAAWGTCGVLCATGIAYPEQRYTLFIITIAIIVVDWAQPTSSGFGATGATFFGSGMQGTGIMSRAGGTWADEDGGIKVRSLAIWNWLSTIVTILLWVIPIVYYYQYPRFN